VARRSVAPQTFTVVGKCPTSERVTSVPSALDEYTETAAVSSYPTSTSQTESHEQSTDTRVTDVGSVVLVATANVVN
jgi:hypothetical protein